MFQLYKYSIYVKSVVKEQKEIHSSFEININCNLIESSLQIDLRIPPPVGGVAKFDRSRGELKTCSGFGLKNI